MRTTLTREMYISTRDTTLFYKDDKNGVEVYHYVTRDLKPAALAFHGKSQKPSMFYYYKNEEERAKAINNFLKMVENRRAIKERVKADRAAFRHTLTVGDILYSSWGYDQTNIDYYQVVEVKEKSVVVCEIAHSHKEEGYLCGRSTPVKDKFIGKNMLKKVGHGNSIRIDSHSYASPHKTGESHYYSQYA